MLQASAICLHVILSSLYSLTTKSFDVSLMGGRPVGFLFRLTFSISSTPFVHRNPIIFDFLHKINPFWQFFFHDVKICSYISIFRLKKVFSLSFPAPFVVFFTSHVTPLGGVVVYAPTLNPQPSTLIHVNYFVSTCNFLHL